MKTERRWLKSAIKAAACEDILLPWAAKRVKNKPISPAPAAMLRVMPMQRRTRCALAAR